MLLYFKIKNKSRLIIERITEIIISQTYYNEVQKKKTAARQTSSTFRRNTVVAFMISRLQSPLSSATAFLVQRNAENDNKYVEIHNDANCTNCTFIGPVFNW